MVHLHTSYCIFLIITIIFLYIIVQSTVLSTIAIIFFIIRFQYRSILGYYSNNNIPEICWMISYLIRDIVLLLMESVMYLGFTFNIKQYYFLNFYVNILL